MEGDEANGRASGGVASSPPADTGVFCKTFCPCAVVYAHSGTKQPDLCASAACCCVYTLLLWKPEGPRQITEPSFCCRCCCPLLAVVGRSEPWDKTPDMLASMLCCSLYTLLCWEPAAVHSATVVPARDYAAAAAASAAAAEEEHMEGSTEGQQPAAAAAQLGPTVEMVR